MLVNSTCNSNVFCLRHGPALATAVTFVVLGILALLNYFDVLRFLPANIAFHPVTLTVAIASFVVAISIVSYQKCCQKVEPEPVIASEKQQKGPKKEASKKRKVVKSKPDVSALNNFISMGGLKFLAEKQLAVVACSSRNGWKNVRELRNRPLFLHRLLSTSLKSGIVTPPASSIPHVVHVTANTVMLDHYYHDQHLQGAVFDRNQPNEILPLEEGCFTEAVLIADGSMRFLKDSAIFDPLQKKRFDIGFYHRPGWFLSEARAQKVFFSSPSEVMGFSFSDHTKPLPDQIFRAQISREHFEVSDRLPMPPGNPVALNSQYVFSVQECNDSLVIHAFAFPELTHYSYRYQNPIWSTVKIHSKYMRADIEQWTQTTFLANDKWVVMSLQRLNSRNEITLYVGAFNADTGKQVFERAVGKVQNKVGYEIRLFGDVVVTWKMQIQDNSQEIPHVWDIAQNRPLLNFDQALINQYQFIKNIVVVGKEVWVSALKKGNDPTVDLQCYTLIDRSAQELNAAAN